MIRHLDWITGADVYQPLSRVLNQDAVLMTLVLVFSFAMVIACLAAGISMLLRRREQLCLGNEGRIMYGLRIVFTGVFFAVLALMMFWPGYRLLLFVLALLCGASISTAALTVRAVFFSK